MTEKNKYIDTLMSKPLDNIALIDMLRVISNKYGLRLDYIHYVHLQLEIVRRVSRDLELKIVFEHGKTGSSKCTLYSTEYINNKLPKYIKYSSLQNEWQSMLKVFIEYKQVSDLLSKLKPTE